MTATGNLPAMSELEQMARDHLWLHFTRMGAYADGGMPAVARDPGQDLGAQSGTDGPIGVVRLVVEVERHHHADARGLGGVEHRLVPVLRAPADDVRAVGTRKPELGRRWGLGHERGCSHE